MVKSGSYHESCDDCTLDSARHGPDDEDRVCYIKCKCHNMDGDRVETKFNLSRRTLAKPVPGD